MAGLTIAGIVGGSGFVGLGEYYGRKSTELKKEAERTELHRDRTEIIDQETHDWNGYLTLDAASNDFASLFSRVTTYVMYPLGTGLLAASIVTILTGNFVYITITIVVGVALGALRAYMLVNRDRHDPAEEGINEKTGKVGQENQFTSSVSVSNSIVSSKRTPKKLEESKVTVDTLIEILGSDINAKIPANYTELNEDPRTKNITLKQYSACAAVGEIKYHADFIKDPKAYLNRLETEREAGVIRGEAQSESYSVAIKYLKELMVRDDYEQM